MPRIKLRTLLIVVMLAGVVWAYAWLYLIRTESVGSVGSTDVRFFRTTWEANIFRPAAAVESFLARRHVMVGWSKAAKADRKTLEAH